jgi:hypothetical protein
MVESNFIRSEFSAPTDRSLLNKEHRAIERGGVRTVDGSALRRSSISR